MTTESPAPGNTLGGFKLEEKIHTGGMASIWRVTREDIALPIAMKIPRLLGGDDPSAIISFEVEQMILPKLSGKHVPRFIAARDFSDQPFLVMERIPGASLESLMSKGPFPADEVVRIGWQAATALHDIHRQHVLHLDVTPDNILFRKTGEAVFIDFGLSRHEQLPDLMAEVYFLPMGTAPYIAPEQVLQVRNEPRSDIFSLGVILYEMITGELPFGSPNSMTGLKRRLYQEPDPPRAVNRDCPRWLQEIVLKCVEVDPERRYGSAAQLAFDLQNPSQVALTARADRSSRAGFVTAFKHWMRYFRSSQPQARSVKRHLAAMPIIMVAVDISPGMEALADMLRQASNRIFYSEKNARLTCVTVRKTPLVSLDSGVDEEGRSLHVRALVELKHWAAQLNIPPDRISFHVLGAPDPAAALVNYAKANQVDHIVIGARGSSTLRRFMGSVSSQVVAQAPCWVTVVRIPHESGIRGESTGYSGHG